MTVQEIQQIGFEKAVFGGYDMKSVDNFLERVADEFSTMQQENAALKAKMKVLVDKVEEYRGMEDGMRRALMRAENLAKDTVDKAKQEAEQIISDAREEAENAKNRIHLEADKLEAARKQTLDFVARVSAVYQAQEKSLVELAKAEKLVHVDEEDMGANVKQEEDILHTHEEAVSSGSTSIATQQPVPVQVDEPLEDATRKFDFKDLKFGSDYDPKA